MKWLLLLALIFAAAADEEKKTKPKPDPEPDPDPVPDPDPDVDDGDPDVYEPIPGSEPLWILPGNNEKVRAHSFGQRRPFGSSDPTTHHAGSDIDADALDPVVMPEDGIVVRNAGWSGPNAKKTTVQLLSGPVIIFGAVHPDHRPQVGKLLRRGELVGRIGTYPGGSTMLHIEQWKVGTWKDKERPRGPWKWDQPRPDALVDPTSYLKSMVR